jgi:hypothetical protein
MALPSLLTRVVGWLRAGYPHGAPGHGYIPLIALLGTRITDDEMTLIAGELAFSSAPESAEEIRKAITAVTRATASDDDVARVRSQLARGLHVPPADPCRLNTRAISSRGPRGLAVQLMGLVGNIVSCRDAYGCMSVLDFEAPGEA